MNSVSNDASNIITDVQSLENLYGAPVGASLDKVAKQLTPLYQRWIEASRFVILSTAGSEGTDGSPRGDDGAVVRIENPSTLLLPDWKGNNRLDSLKNIVTDGRVSLLFMVGGCNNVVRVNGSAVLSIDESMIQSFQKGNVVPKTVVVVSVGEVYFQCAKSLMRSQLWQGEPGAVPSAGDFLKEVDSSFEGEKYDQNYAVNAKPRMW